MVCERRSGVRCHYTLYTPRCGAQISTTAVTEHGYPWCSGVLGDRAVAARFLLLWCGVIRARVARKQAVQMPTSSLLAHWHCRLLAPLTGTACHPTYSRYNCWCVLLCTSWSAGAVVDCGGASKAGSHLSIAAHHHLTCIAGSAVLPHAINVCSCAAQLAACTTATYRYLKAAQDGGGAAVGVRVTATHGGW